MFNETFFLLLLFRYFFFAFIIIQSLAWVIFFFLFFQPVKNREKKNGKEKLQQLFFLSPRLEETRKHRQFIYIHYTQAKLVPEWIFLLFLRTSHVFSFNVALMKKKRKEKKRKKSIVDSVKIIRWKMFRRWMKYDHRSNIDHEEERWMVKDTFQNPLALLFARNENEKIRLGSSLARGQSSENYTRVCKYICSFDTRCRHPLNSRLSLLGVMKQKPIGLQSQLSK